MKVTRDVIYDLLPAYFAGDASDDTRALVEAYFETDPEFGRMATRFHAIADRQHKGSGATADPDATDRERETFCYAREAAELPQKARASALLWGFASLFGFGMALLTWNDRMGYFHPGIILGVGFGVAAVAVFVLSFRVKPNSWWRGLAGLDDATLRSAGLGTRRSRRRLGA
jgi:anti-sigma factor RsiW